MVRFFINRPIFATVIAIIMITVGGLCIFILPIAQYPEIVPPQVQVAATYAGASSQVVADTVTTPLEDNLNGVEGMIYMSSNSTNNGNSVITITFDVGYPVDIAEVDVLNDTTPAKPLIPPIVLKAGLTIQKVSSNMLMAVNLISPNGTYDTSFLTNYADAHIVDVLRRIPGVGQVTNYGYLYSIRIWLNPDKMSSLGITTSDVTNAIEQQNVQAASGQVGAPPAPSKTPFTYQINTLGRLSQVKQFENIIVKVESNGAIVRLKDIAKVQVGAQSYDVTVKLNKHPTNVMMVYQLPGANAIQISKQVREAMQKLSQRFPQDMKYVIPYDIVTFVNASLEEVVVTLFEAIILVVIVVFVFLQSVRTAVIPCIAIPVSLIATFAFMKLFGFSINLLSLLGLVLAIGLVVDDAIVVVENVERRLAEGSTNLRQTTYDAMREVQGPIIATTLILMAVFVPVAFMPGMTGQLYNQFALTIAFAVGLSGINSLSLTPALCAILLKHGEKNPGFFFRWFNRGFAAMVKGYKKIVATFIKYWYIILMVFAGLAALTYLIFSIIPTGFIPEEDQGFFFVTTQGPDASSLQRTQKTLERVGKEMMSMEGVENFLSVSGLNIITGVSQINSGLGIVLLKPWDERKASNLHARALIMKAQKKLAYINDAQISVSNPPAIPGLGAVGGFDLQLQDVNGMGTAALADVTNKFLAELNVSPVIYRAFTTFSNNVPGIYLDIDRTKAMAMGVAVNDILSTLQSYLGSFYVNQVNQFNKTYQVIIQASPEARAQVKDIGKLYVRNNQGGMVPVNSFVKIEHTKGPFNLPHYNLYPSAEINGMNYPKYSSGQAIKTIEEIAAKVLPSGFAYQWTGMTYQQLKAGNAAPFIFALCLFFVFLFLSALYESWAMPLMILLSVPLALLGATGALLLRELPLDVYGQIGLILLIGLTAKNAILIVEFAKDKRDEGFEIVEAAVTAARLRIRPILMTSFAFILGVLPLFFASGAGANARHSIGTVVLGGMLLSTVLSLLVVPVFYVVIQKLRERISGGRKRDIAE